MCTNVRIENIKEELISKKLKEILNSRIKKEQKEQKRQNKKSLV